jgi:hypothetical protein
MSKNLSLVVEDRIGLIREYLRTPFPDGLWAPSDLR